MRFLHPLRWRRLPAIVAGICATVGLPAGAFAATITVTTTAMTIDAGSVDPHTGLTATATDLDMSDLPGPDGFVSLPEAIIAANNTAGADTIELGTGATYTIGTPTNFWYGPTALPPITSDITIEGNGATIERDGAAGKMRLMFVGGNLSAIGGGALTLRNLTLQNGLARGGNGGNGGSTAGGGGGGMGGAIFNQGILTLENVTLTANTAQGGAGGNSTNAFGSRGSGGGMGGDGLQSTQAGGGGFRTNGTNGNGGDFTTTEGASGATGGTSLFGGDGGNGVGGGGGGAGGGFNLNQDGANGSGTNGGTATGNGGDGGDGNNNGGGGGAFGGGGSGSNLSQGGGGGGGVGGGGGRGMGGGAGGFGGGGGSNTTNLTGVGGFGGGGGSTTNTGNDVPGGFGGGAGSRTNGNNAPGGGGAGFGGAIFNLAGTISLTNCTIAGNSAIGGAGGDATAGNGNGGFGGSGFGAGIFNVNGTVTALNCTLAGNTVTPGPAGNDSGSGSPGVSGSADGGAFYNLGAGGTATFNLTNCICADTTGGNDAMGFTIAAGTSTIGGSTNLIETQTGVPGGIIFSTSDPQLGPLQFNGGRTFTMAIPQVSPAADSGTNAGAPATDQRGVARPFNGAVDIGAVEFSPNQAPTLTVPGAQNATEDTALVFSAGNGNAIAVADADVGTNDLEITLTATNGTITLATVANLNFTTGDGTADATMTFTGAQAAVNAALDGMSFTGNQNFNGAGASMQIDVDDLGNTGDGGPLTDTETVSITVAAVNDVPSFTAANPPTILEDAGAQTVNNWASGISAGAADEAGQTVSFTVSNISNAAMFAVAPAVAVNGTLTYTPAADAVGTVTFDVTISDDGGTANGGVDTSAPQTFTITITGVNDVPSFTASNPPDVAEIAGAQTVANWATPSAGPANESSQTVSFSVSNVSNPGIFTVTPAVDANGNLTYTPNGTIGSSTFDVAIMDNGGTANGGVDTSAVQNFTINVVAFVNQAPTFTVTATVTTPPNPGEQTVLGWATITSTGGAGEESQITSFIVSNVSDPSFFTAGPSVSADGTLRFTPSEKASGMVTFQLQAKDDGGTANGGVDTSAAQTVTIVVRENTGNGCGAIATADADAMTGANAAALAWLLGLVLLLAIGRYRRL